MNFGMSELLLVLAIAFLLFGAKRLPELGGALGKAIKEFKKGLTKSDEIDVTPEEKKEKNEENQNK